jgi:hypothetical protein
MDISEAQSFVSRERVRWYLGAAGLSDDELLRSRERLHNGLSMFFAFAFLVGYFILGTLLSRFGDLIALYGTLCTLIVFVLAARRHILKARDCRDVREFLKSQLREPSA